MCACTWDERVAASSPRASAGLSRTGGADRGKLGFGVGGCGTAAAGPAVGGEAPTEAPRPGAASEPGRSGMAETQRRRSGVAPCWLMRPPWAGGWQHRPGPETGRMAPGLGRRRPARQGQGDPCGEEGQRLPPQAESAQSLPLPRAVLRAAPSGLAEGASDARSPSSRLFRAPWGTPHSPRPWADSSLPVPTRPPSRSRCPLLRRKPGGVSSPPRRTSTPEPFSSAGRPASGRRLPPSPREIF